MSIFGNLKDLKKMKEQADKMKKALSNITLIAKNSDTGEVEIKITGNMEVQEVKINKEAYKEDQNFDKLANDVKAAVNSAIQQAQYTAAGQAQSMLMDKNE